MDRHQILLDKISKDIDLQLASHCKDLGLSLMQKYLAKLDYQNPETLKSEIINEITS
jgi:hypothetical protein